MPVSPAITDGSHAPLGVAENTLPMRSTTFTQVVSRVPADEPPPEGIGSRAAECAGPAVPSTRARGSISLRRSAAYSFESSICSGILENFGSP